MNSAIKQDYVMLQARAAGAISREEMGDNEIYFRQLSELPFAGYLSFIYRIANVTHNRTREEFANPGAVKHFEKNILPMPPSEDALEIYDLLSIVGPTTSVYDDIEQYEVRADNLLSTAMQQAYNDCSIIV